MKSLFLLSAACLLACGCATPALYRPAETGDIPAMRALLEKGADPNETSALWMRLTPLHMAAAKSQLEAARLLIERGADVNRVAVINRSRQTRPLHYAACNGDVSMIKLLLDNGADPEPGGGECAEPGWSVMSDIRMISPLALAEKNGHTMAAALIKDAIAAKAGLTAGGMKNSGEYRPIVGALLKDYRGDGRTIAVAGFSYADGRASSDGRVVAERITTELIKHGGLKVVERREIEKVLGELKLQLSGQMDQDSVKKLGKMLGADLLVIGTITALPGGKLELNARLAGVESGEAYSAVSGQVEKNWL
ncbi:MAG: FlgO family outer membrane protein [Elusimicrobiales bacterium]|nr:FlgO family outer membrane protein [Elusimicrobiales bacterium]